MKLIRENVYPLTFNIDAKPPGTPSLWAFNYIQHTNPKSEEFQSWERIQYCSTGIVLKAEFAKESVLKIKEACEKIGTKGEKGIKLQQDKIFVIIKELDLVLFELHSLLELLARILDYVFQFKICKKTTFAKVVNKIKKLESTDAMTQRIVSFYDSDSHQYFRKMRNRSTHRLPFTYSGTNLDAYLPDDPDEDDPVYSIKKKIELYPTVKQWLFEILALVDDVCEFIGVIWFEDKWNSEEFGLLIKVEDIEY